MSKKQMLSAQLGAKSYLSTAQKMVKAILGNGPQTALTDEMQDMIDECWETWGLRCTDDYEQFRRYVTLWFQFTTDEKLDMFKHYCAEAPLERCILEMAEGCCVQPRPRIAGRAAALRDDEREVLKTLGVGDG